MSIRIVSSHGFVYADSTGAVTDDMLDADFGAPPVYINWPEWQKTYPGEALPDSVDILDVGYVDADGVYSEPCEEWRADRRARLADTLVCEKAAWDASARPCTSPRLVVDLCVAQALEQKLRKAVEALKHAHTSLRTFSGVDSWVTLDADTLALLENTLVELEGL